MRFLFTLLLFFLFSCKSARVYKVQIEEIAAYKLQDCDTLLDIGCGNARFDRMIAQQYPQIYFVLEDLPVVANTDVKQFVSKTMVHSKYAPGIEKRYEFVAGSQDTIPLPSEKFSTILCRMAFHEFTNKDKMAEEITRMLKPHGMLLLVEREPLYEGHTDKYCKNKYVSVSTVRNTFKHLRLVDTTKMMYPGGAVSVMRFTK